MYNAQQRCFVHLAGSNDANSRLAINPEPIYDYFRISLKIVADPKSTYPLCGTVTPEKSTHYERT